MKSEGADKKKLCQILESLVLLDPSSELTQEYAKLKQQLGEWKESLMLFFRSQSPVQRTLKYLIQH